MHNVKIIGKITEKMIPSDKLFPVILAVNPTILGPSVLPVSPAKARSAKSVVPVAVNFSVARLNVPGQKTPHEKPQRANPIKEIGGILMKAVMKNEAVQRMPQKNI